MGCFIRLLLHSENVPDPITPSEPNDVHTFLRLVHILAQAFEDDPLHDKGIETCQVF